jgi:hypothetical protein
MGRAFLNDPLWKYLVPDDAKRARVVSLSMGILVRYGFLYGEIYTTSMLDGVACWLTPGETTSAFGRMVLIGIRNATLEIV